MKNKNIIKPDFWKITTIIFFLLAIVFIIYPLIGLVFRSFLQNDGGKLTLANYVDFFKLPYYFRTLKNSFYISMATTVLAVVLGLPMAYVVSRYNIPGKKVLNIMIVISLLSPPFIGAYAWIMLFGRGGFITKFLIHIGMNMPTIYGFKGMLLVFTLKFFPFIYMYVLGALGSMDRSLEEAAENLGVGTMKRIFTITLPLIIPTLTAGIVMVFMTVLSDIGTPMLMGEGFKVLPLVIYDEFLSEIGGNVVFASSMGVVLIIFSLSVLFIQRNIISKREYNMSGLRPPEVKELSPLPRFLFTFGCYLVAFIALLPQITTVVTSFVKTKGPLFVRGFSFQSYREVWFKLGDSILHTFTYSTVAIVLMIIIGILAAYLVVRRKSRTTAVLDFLVMSTYVIPGSVLGIILIMAFNKPPLLLAGTSTILIISYTIRKMPFLFRSSVGILYQLDPSIEEASINLGVPPLKTFFSITAVLMLPGVVSGAVLSWIASINEFSSSIILYSGKTKTITVTIFTEIFKDSYGTAAALGSILTFSAILALVIFNKLTDGKGSVV